MEFCVSKRDSGDRIAGACTCCAHLEYRSIWRGILNLLFPFFCLISAKAFEGAKSYWAKDRGLYVERASGSEDGVAFELSVVVLAVMIEVVNGCRAA